ncbi:MAG: hypothetical protein ACKO1J_17830, partial [Tagaea sp.]
ESEFAKKRNPDSFKKHHALDKAGGAIPSKAIPMMSLLVLSGALFVLFILLFAIFLELLILYVTLSSALGLMSDPTSARADFKWVVGALACGAILTRLLIQLIQIPLPYSHYPNLDKLAALEKSDPKEYDRQMKLSSESDRRNRQVFKRWIGSMVGSIAAVTWGLVERPDVPLFTLSNVVLVFYCIVAVGFAGNQISETVRQRAFIEFFKAHPRKFVAEDTKRLDLFSKVKRRQHYLWLSLCLVLTALAVLIHRLSERFLFGSFQVG